MSDVLKPSRMAILLLLVSYASISAVIFTPSLPEISQYFQISENLAQWTMSFFLIGYTLGMLLYGPLANRFGRKKTIYIGIGLSLIGILISLSMNSFGGLCFGRFVQALGASVGIKIGFTMIGDVHSGDSATRAISLMSLAFGVMPGVGVAIGGFIAVYWGWHGALSFMALYSIFLGLLCLLLPETAKELNPDALQLPKIVHGYARQFKDSFTTLHASLMGLCSAAIYIFATVAPYIGIERIGLSPDAYGLWCLIPSAGLATGMLIVFKLAGKTRPRIAMLSGILVMLIGVVLLSLSFANQWINPFSFFFSVFVMQIGNSILWAFASSKCISESTDKSNTSAVMQFFNLSFATIGTFAVGLFSPQNILLLPTAFCLLVIGMLSVWLKLREHHLRSPH